MPARLKVPLDQYQRLTLEQMRDHHPKAYARERAAALLKIADGSPASHVARQGLLKLRTNETIGLWVKAYQNQGIVGLLIKQGRGRKPLFSPRLLTSNDGAG